MFTIGTREVQTHATALEGHQHDGGFILCHENTDSLVTAYAI
jgi:hypothetical protein